MSWGFLMSYMALFFIKGMSFSYTFIFHTQVVCLACVICKNSTFFCTATILSHFLLFNIWGQKLLSLLKGIYFKLHTSRRQAYIHMVKTLPNLRMIRLKTWKVFYALSKFSTNFSPSNQKNWVFIFITIQN